MKDTVLNPGVIPVNMTDKISLCVDLQDLSLRGFTVRWEVADNKLLHGSARGDIYFEKMKQRLSWGWGQFWIEWWSEKVSCRHYF